MTEDEKKKLKAGYVALSAYYQRPMDDFVVRMYVDDLAPMTFSEAVEAMVNWRKNPRNKTVPLPAELKAISKPDLTDEQLALESVSRIVQAISKYGHTNEDRAKAFIGELGWAVVVREGGWPRMCAIENTRELSFLKAQWLKLALAVQAMAKAGKLNEAPRLPSTNDMQSRMVEGMQPVMIGEIINKTMEPK